MAELVLRGMLVEYSGQFLGPLPNIVVFQFNPESIARTVTIPQRAETSGSERPARERGQAAAPPTESFTLTAHFTAADDLGAGGALSAVPRVFGVGPQLAALEKMVYPPRTPGGLLGAAIDAVASALSSGSESATRTVPREQVPRVLFIWGPTRVLPVTITSLSLTEQKFDFLLNPVQAQVQIGIAVASQPPDDDVVAKGALEYSSMIKDTQATLNLVKAVELALDIVPF